MARIAERNGKTESARKAYQRILDQDPQHLASLHRMAVTSVGQERLDEAIQFFQQGMAAGEPNAEFLGDYGYALYLAERMDESEKVLRQSLRLAPDSARVTNNLAMVVGRNGNYNESYQLFQSAGNESQALANLAFVQSQQGDVTFAKKNYHSALDIDPSLKVAANGLMEVYRAFPSDKPMIIKPYQESQEDVTRLVSHRAAGRGGSALSVDDLVQSFSTERRASNSISENPNGTTLQTAGQGLIRRIDSDKRHQVESVHVGHKQPVSPRVRQLGARAGAVSDRANSESYVLQTGFPPKTGSPRKHRSTRRLPIQSSERSTSPAMKLLRQENSVPESGPAANVDSDR